MKSGKWVTGWICIVLSLLLLTACTVYYVDPFMHYHKPLTDKFFYTLNNQRSQNDGIIRFFDYDAVITGSSMTQNFLSSEMDDLFGCNSIKVTYPGASFNEINQNIELALDTHPEVKLVVRGLDDARFDDPADIMRTDLGVFPTYLYDDNIFNDVKYIYNRDVFFPRTMAMLIDGVKKDHKTGITSFDKYSRWQEDYKFGINEGVKVLSAEALRYQEPDSIQHLTDEEKEVIKANIEQNVTSLADKHKDVTFHYFLTPYGIAAWCKLKYTGRMYKRIEAEKYVAELILPHENIHLYGFNSREDILTDLNNYRDQTHYGSWVNSLILKWIHDGDYRLTLDNYEEYFEKEQDFFENYDYESLEGQEDYEADFYAGALLNRELTGAEPVSLMDNNTVEVDSFEGYADLSDGHNYLSFYGRVMEDGAHPNVHVYDDNGEIVGETVENYDDIDDGVHQYVIDLSMARGKVKIVFDSENAGYLYKDIMLY